MKPKKPVDLLEEVQKEMAFAKAHPFWSVVLRPRWGTRYSVLIALSPYIGFFFFCFTGLVPLALLCVAIGIPYTIYFIISAAFNS